MPEKKVTMYTIAEEVGVSIAAVSRAFDPTSRLKPEKRALILDTARRLGYVPNKMASRLSGRTMRFGALICGSIPEYYNEYVAGIEEAHSEFADYKVDCEIVVKRKGETPDGELYAAIDRFIDEGLDGVILSGFNGKSDVARINRLADARIPFIVLGTDIPGCKRSGVSMNDVQTAGRLAAQLVSLSIGGAERGQVSVLCDDMVDMGQQRLVNSFCASAERYGISVASVLPTYNSYDTAYRLTQDILTRYPDIAGIYVSTANSIAVCRGIHEAGLSGKIGLVTSDVFDALNDYIRRGTVCATISQNPYRQAKSAFEALFYHAADGVDIPEFIHVHPQAVFDSNLPLYTR